MKDGTVCFPFFPPRAFFLLISSLERVRRELCARVFNDNEIIVGAAAWCNLWLVDLSLGLSGLYLRQDTCRSLGIDPIYHASIYNKRSGWEKQCFQSVCVTPRRSFTIWERGQSEATKKQNINSSNSRFSTSLFSSVFYYSFIVYYSFIIAIISSFLFCIYFIFLS